MQIPKFNSPPTAEMANNVESSSSVKIVYIEKSKPQNPLQSSFRALNLEIKAEKQKLKKKQSSMQVQ